MRHSDISFATPPDPEPQCMILPVGAACRPSAASRITAVCWKTLGSWTLILQPPVRCAPEMSRLIGYPIDTSLFYDVVLLIACIVVPVVLRMRHARDLVVEIARSYKIDVGDSGRTLASN